MIRARTRSKSPSPRADADTSISSGKTKAGVNLLRNTAAYIACGTLCLILIIIWLTSGSNSKASLQIQPGYRTMQPGIEAAVAFAARAGQEIVRLKDTVAEAQNGKEPVTIADETSHNILMQMPLGQTAIISEEGVSPGATVRDTEVALFVDPLDATQEYTEGLTQYVSIQICFFRCGRTVASVLHFPFTGRTLVATPSNQLLDHPTHHSLLSALRKIDGREMILPPAPTCDCDDYRDALVAFQPVELPAKGNIRRPKEKTAALRLIVTRSHFLTGNRSSSGTLSMGTSIQVLQEVYPNLVIERAGGAGYKLAAVLSGDADAYIHDGPIRMWDVCAGAALVRAGGGVVTDWLGEEHRFCTPLAETTMKKTGYAVRGIIATRDAALHKELVDVIRGRMGSPSQG